MFDECAEMLSPADACNLFKLISVDRVSHVPAFEPRSGQMFMYETASYFTKALADKHQWCQESKECFIVGPDSLHIVICVQIEEGVVGTLMRFYYTLLNNPQYTLVHYVADEESDVLKDQENICLVREYEKCSDLRSSFVDTFIGPMFFSIIN